MNRKEEQILVAATRLFARFGLRKTSVEDIAKAAGVGKGTIYLFFESKEALFATVVRREAHRMLAKVKAAVDQESSAEAKLRAFITTRYRLVDETFELYQMAQDVLLELWPAVKEALVEYRREERALIESILDYGRDRGEFVMDDTGLISVAIAATLEVLDMPWILDGQEVVGDIKVETLVSLFVRGLASDRA